MKIKLLFIFSFVAAAVIGLAKPSAAPVVYVANLNGPSESPANSSSGTGLAQVTVDLAKHLLHVEATFSGLSGTTTAAHIHAPTAVPFTGVAGVATQIPTFIDFPLGVTSGTYSHAFDMRLTSTWNPSFVTANGGTAAGAEAAFLQALAEGKAYLNIHTTAFPGGEIRGFLKLQTKVTQITLYGGIGRGSPLNAGSLVTIDPATGVGTLVGRPDAVPGLAGLAFDISGTLYGATISGELGTGRFSNLVRIDPNTGAQIGPAVTITYAGVPIAITDLAVQPGTERLYGTSLDETDFINTIYVIDPATGVALLIGRTGVTGATLAFGPDGTLYQTSAEFDQAGNFIHGFLNTLDPNTGAVLTTSAPFTLHHVGGLAVRPTDGVIFASGGDEGGIYTLSPNGVQTLVGFTNAGGVGDLDFTPQPTSKDQCKSGGWSRFNFPFRFKNQGDCIQFVNTGK
jgi:hypothetical protein